MSRAAYHVPAMGDSTPPILRVVSAGWSCVPPESSFPGKPHPSIRSRETAPGGRDRGLHSSHDILGGYMKPPRDSKMLECASCHQEFACLVVHNEATGTYLCRNCDAFWSCATCGRTYLNDGAILLTGRCSGCASDNLTWSSV